MHQKPPIGSRTAEEGFALPSVLFLVVILTVLCSSILSVQYFKRQLLLHDLAQKKAQLAAVNGITQFCAEPASQTIEQSLRYDDGTTANVSSVGWGIYRVAWSEGRYEKAKHLNIALLGAIPDSNFSNALTFSNSLHQLIFAGASQVIGDVETGQAGITTGVLANRMSPHGIPVEGRIRRGGRRKSPFFDFEALGGQIDAWDRYLEKDMAPWQHSPAIYQIVEANSFANQRLNLSGINDSVQAVVIKGDVEFSGALARRGPPLVIAVRGHITFSGSVRMLGLVTLCSSEPIRIPQAVSAEHILLYSQKSISFESGSSLTLQAIAPSIFLVPGVELHYPSALISNCSDTLSLPRELLVSAGSRVEGVVYMMKRSNLKSRDDLLTIEKDASVTGTVVCEEKMTLDGVVKGSVTTDDFYFYESPTHYYGWLREGSIDRRALTPGFLIPEAFAEKKTLAVIDWL